MGPVGSSTAEHVRLAARNNALWCDAMCRAHGVPGEMLPCAWVNRHEPPPFHSNVVTLTDASGVDQQMGAIEDLLNAVPSRFRGVKDSFCCLDLSPLEFEVLFEANWIWRPAGDGASDGSMDWTRVTTSDALEMWEQLWRNDSVHADIGCDRLFRPVLLDDPDHALLWGCVDDAPVAVAIANRTGPVVGLSNVFAPGFSSGAHWSGCIDAVSRLFPGLPIVGYERGQDLADAQAVGFSIAGPLRVWVRSS